MLPFKTLLRVRHYEMDALGHVNNAVYQNYLEQAAIEHSEYLGLTLDVYRQVGGVFVMRRVEIDYLRPAVAGDTLEVTTWLKEMRGTRALRCYEIRKQNQDNLLVTAEALWVWVDAQTMRPRPIPSVMLDKFLQIQNPGVTN
ncbi:MULTISPECIES: acyl-CoA thioesterase [Nostoc]|uniref:Acyl-CoA thioesterase n=1 Tax=Nostoc favosum CHAB5714 TaxID=2780399 RepID=A0ABS8IIA8_9NOSO|nr:MULTISPECIES: thioesterase family protein [Nostoc]MCL6752353.1 acyl-CoA thioesterase [Nostoc sp. CCCryo 231-06]MBG1264738.1 acyl-CoA thioesterase [Nostoc commune BAE]MCC5603576.1 acyl-CoA thioesterase [Nostoc favosum CHAB5714]MDZ8123993.1 thioesterase family protein [Nostoc sp. CmiVER01]MDZ8225503.1 thioesterase family protein [Nostoc sp. ChiVER01]